MTSDDHDAIVRLTTEMSHLRNEMRELKSELRSLHKEHTELNKKVVANGLKLGLIISFTVVVLSFFDETIKHAFSFGI